MSLPLPPEQQARGLRLHTIAAGSQWFRIHRCRHADALHWGRHDQGRWNAIDGAFGVLYLADSLEIAFDETYGHQVIANHGPAAVKFLTRQELEERCITRLTATRQLQVLDLREPVLARLNLDARLLTTREQLPVCQAWSGWWHDAVEQPDGLLYPSDALASCQRRTRRTGDPRCARLGSGGLMSQGCLVRQLVLALKAAQRRPSQRHGRSMGRKSPGDPGFGSKHISAGVSNPDNFKAGLYGFLLVASRHLSSNEQHSCLPQAGSHPRHATHKLQPSLAGATVMGMTRHRGPMTLAKTNTERTPWSEPYTYWRESNGCFLGYLNAYPDHWTQGDDLEDLKEQLLDLFREFSKEDFPGIRKVGELFVA